MSVQITELTREHVPAVTHFNARLRDGQMPMQFPTEVIPRWLPPGPGRSLFQQPYVAVDAAGHVRGGYILKHQPFKIGDDLVPIADLRLPISEGTVDRTYAGLAVELLFNALGKQPLLFGMGIGGYSEAVAQLFEAARWRLSTVPFYFKVQRPFRFCRGIRFLRRRWQQRLILDAAAWTGLAWIGNTAMRVIRPSRGDAKVTVEIVDDFGPWADQLWSRCCDDYGMIALRDSESLQALYPRSDSRFIRLRINGDDGPIGWCVLLDTQLIDHKQFGNLRLGSIVDSLAALSDAPAVMQAADRFLATRRVDLVICNHGHRAWGDALLRCGFLRGPSNYLFASSRKLTKLIEAAQVRDDELFLNRGDGDGPINL